MIPNHDGEPSQIEPNITWCLPTLLLMGAENQPSFSHGRHGYKYIFYYSWSGVWFDERVWISSFSAPPFELLKFWIDIHEGHNIVWKHIQTFSIRSGSKSLKLPKSWTYILYMFVRACARNCRDSRLLANWWLVQGFFSSWPLFRTFFSFGPASHVFGSLPVLVWDTDTDTKKYYVR